MANGSYPRGSEWRKWDLHVHTPQSIIQNYGGDTTVAWDAFIQKLASLPPEIKVIGITDYLFCDGYEHLLTRRAEIPNIELIIPNIEFRLNTFSGTANDNKRHNYHVLFDPTVNVLDIREQLLGGLVTAYKIQDGSVWNQTPTIRSLEKLGSDMKAAAPEGNSIHSKTDLEVGFISITYKREDIEKLLQKDCFKGKTVTALGYAEWEQTRWDQSAAEKRNLINSVDFCLTAQSDPAKINENRQELMTNNLNALVLHSSDAHELENIGNALLWVKADPTFAGLKQVLNEPEARVFNGDTPPNYKHDHKVIKSISIPSSKGWFIDNFNLELSRDLVTLIGGRGSGKSALAEAIAYGAGSKDESEDAFLKKAAKHIKQPITGTKIHLEWADGESTEFEVGKLTHDQGLIRYLPQGIVEELCSHKNSKILQEQIENVIFQKLDETQRMGASNFEELRTMVLGSFQYEKEQARDKIQDCNRKISNLLGVIHGQSEKEKILTEKKAELDRLIKGLPVLPPEDQKGQEELAALVENKKKFEGKIIEIQTSLTKITETETSVKIFKEKARIFKEEIDAHLKALEIEDLKAFEINLDEKSIKVILESKRLELTGQLKTLKSGKKDAVASLLGVETDILPFENLDALNKGIEEKQRTTKAFETTKLKYQAQKKNALDTEAAIKALDGEIAKIISESKPALELLEAERLKVFCSYFELLKNEKVKIEELYQPLQDSLLTGTDTDKKLAFEAKIDYQLESQIKSGLDIIDRSRKGNFREADVLKSLLNDCWEELVRNEFQEPSIESNIKNIICRFTECEGKPLATEEQLRENYGIEDFFNWLYEPSYFTIVSSLKFDDTELYLLSPGQKGIILLMLYLEIDKADYRPLIIDQPEENLDNLSVYKDLLNYFRERKQHRQIIMVTHNPNLVVNTDAEQIIVASYSGKRTPKLEYQSGSLEDQAKNIPDATIDSLEDGIIEQVCNILEGGDKAFSRRKKKYQISSKSQMQF